MRCIFIYNHEAKYEVSTYWGHFRLDEGAYRDYLAGKLWVCWYPKNAKVNNSTPVTLPDVEPCVDVSEEATALYDAAAKNGIYSVLQRFYPGGEIVVPYRKRMADVPIEEMNLSVRSTNGLKRANAHTFGSLKMLLELETGLKGIRNLGTKSEKEIKQGFLTTCYSLLSKGEKLEFWQRILDGDHIKHK